MAQNYLLITTSVLPTLNTIWGPHSSQNWHILANCPQKLQKWHFQASIFNDIFAKSKLVCLLQVHIQTRDGWWSKFVWMWFHNLRKPWNLWMAIFHLFHDFEWKISFLCEFTWKFESKYLISFTVWIKIRIHGPWIF